MTKENITINDEELENGYQILVTGIKWNKKKIPYFKRDAQTPEELPEQFSLELPDNVLKQSKGDTKSEQFENIIESFVYNFLTRKFGHEVWHCQIWLPFDEETKRQIFEQTKDYYWYQNKPEVYSEPDDIEY